MNNREFITRRIMNAFVATKDEDRSTFRSLLTRRVSGYINLIDNTIFYTSRSAAELLIDVFVSEWIISTTEQANQIEGLTYFTSDNLSGRSNAVLLSTMPPNTKVEIIPNAFYSLDLFDYCTIAVTNTMVHTPSGDMFSCQPTDTATILLDSRSGTEYVKDIYPGNPRDVVYNNEHYRCRTKTAAEAIKAGFTYAQIV